MAVLETNIPDIDTSLDYFTQVSENNKGEKDSISLSIKGRLTYKQVHAAYLIEMYNMKKDITAIITLPDKMVNTMAQMDILRNAVFESNELVGRECNIEDIPIINIESEDVLSKFIVEFHLDESAQNIKFIKLVKPVEK